MPAPRPTRVPPEFAREVMQKAARDGILAVQIALMWDQYDHFQAELDARMGRFLATDLAQVADIHRRQGALAQLEKTIRMFEMLAEAGRAEANGDGLMTRPATIRVRKRPATRSA